MSPSLHTGDKVTVKTMVLKGRISSKGDKDSFIFVNSLFQILEYKDLYLIMTFLILNILMNFSFLNWRSLELPEKWHWTFFFICSLSTLIETNNTNVTTLWIQEEQGNYFCIYFDRNIIKNNFVLAILQNFT